MKCFSLLAKPLLFIFICANIVFAQYRSTDVYKGSQEIYLYFLNTKHHLDRDTSFVTMKELKSVQGNLSFNGERVLAAIVHDSVIFNKIKKLDSTYNKDRIYIGSFKRIGMGDFCISLEILGSYQRDEVEGLILQYLSHWDSQLIKVVRKGDYHGCKTAIKHGAHINNVIGFQKRTPLMIAAENGHKEIVRLLLEHDAKINNTLVMMPDEDDKFKSTGGWSALMLASAAGHLSTVKVLLEYNADTSIKGFFEVTAMSLARHYRYHAIVREIFDAEK